MAETAPLPTALSTSASPLKRAKNKPAASRTPKKSGVTLPERIIKAVGSSKERNGLSMFALKRALEADGYDLQQNSFRVKTAVKKLVESERLVQTKGKGAAGSFKLNKEKSAKAKKGSSPRKVAKTQTKVKAAKKATKKPALKKTVRKISPKKAKTPASASSKPSRKTSAKVKKPVKKVLSKTNSKTKARKPKSKPAAKALKNKKATPKKK